MRFLYRLFLTLSLLGMASILLTTKTALDGPQIDFDETIVFAQWAWLFTLTTALLAFMFATLHENKRGRR